jgi:hypothetical protein
MILPFLKEINGKETYFAEKIWANKLWTKEENDQFYSSTRNKLIIHTILDMDYALKCTPKIHTIRADVKNRWKVGAKIHAVYHNRQKNQIQFAPVFECKGIQKIEISNYGLSIRIDDFLVPLGEINILTKNDGFDNVNEFLSFFENGFTGKIIHFTDLKY